MRKSRVKTLPDGIWEMQQLRKLYLGGFPRLSNPKNSLTDNCLTSNCRQNLSIIHINGSDNQLGDHLYTELNSRLRKAKFSNYKKQKSPKKIWIVQVLDTRELNTVRFNLEKDAMGRLSRVVIDKCSPDLIKSIRDKTHRSDIEFVVNKLCGLQEGSSSSVENNRTNQIGSPLADINGDFLFFLSF
ncbi:hypothetical protein BVC80_1313g6 [Macleaya cordata]|uniref:Uncharacterized protein n=1 Tax=Macleaya cordata TaxID=56857 RepID=A0A200QYY9_MACCD|nr:hypothetical protein BVC80_1313g6 [Macleaya cordata]